MNQWHNFLQAQGAIISDNAVQHFNDANAELQAATQQTIIADLSHLGLLEIEGDDASTFLQGQFTNDIKQLTGQSSQYTGYCTAKGRLLTIFFAFSHLGHYHLQCDKSLLEALSKRLRMYVMRSKVVIKDVSDNIVRLGVAGAESSALLAKHFNGTTLNVHEIATLENGVLARLPDGSNGTPRYQIYTNPEHAEQLWSALTTSAHPVGKSVWDWLEIQAGIPEISPKTQEVFVPQMVNLDALNGINFKKGCYTGQEIVARTHYLGKVKRRTQLAHIATETAPQAGDALTAADGAEAGEIVRSAPSPVGGFDVLAEVRLESLEAGEIHWQGQALAIKALPYTLS